MTPAQWAAELRDRERDAFERRLDEQEPWFIAGCMVAIVAIAVLIFFFG